MEWISGCTKRQCGRTPGGPGFPVFLYIGGEGAESGRAIR